MISDIIKQVLQTGYLSVTTEHKLRLMFENCSTLEELDALSELQAAILSGQVTRDLCVTAYKGGSVCVESL
ncbi:hypothetical protein [Laspinema olomoucense]|uniref:Uncharacterized protein n=1 Tax=Laspinema olomoucense D3b TaxID=2953688 RepID=A0ABT2N5K3_9CYAN|nr:MULTISPECIES: hypothetical protein [unclassified Laspinema]MCT7977979.1 hypothetical protein [Laspinema sp. D3b]MCT7994247.1 hypothetical protein [Laspinema sp. D3c]